MEPPTGTILERHERLVASAERLHALAEIVDADTSYALLAGLPEALASLDGELLPHMEAIEEELYPRLEGLLGSHHSMAPMREEHQRLRELVATLRTYEPAVAGGRLDAGGVMALRRVLYRLHSMLRVHLAEERTYLAALEGRLSSRERDELGSAIDEAGAERL